MTRREIQTLLAELSNSLRGEIEAAQTELKQARALATSINRLFTNASELLAKLNNPDAGVEAKLNQATANAASIAEILSAARTELTTIQSSVANAQQNASNMESAYSAFEATRTKINDPTLGLEAIQANAQRFSSQVQAAAASSAKIQEQIQQSLGVVQQTLKTVQDAYASFESTQAKINNEHTGLEATLTSSQEIKSELESVGKECETLYKEISRYKDSAAKNIASIEAIKSDSEKSLETIRERQSESESIKDKISSIFEIVSQTGHANYFDNRRKRLIYASWAWLGLAVICAASAVTLGLVYIVPLVKAQDHSTGITIDALLVRLSVLTPIVALGLFSVSNYAKERRLAEQYAFKGVSASTVEGSIALLERALADAPNELKQQKIVDFAVETIQCIHKEPLELIRSSKVKVNATNKLVQIGGELSQSVEALSENLQKFAPGGGSSGK